jgi:hypothetical protein
MLIQLPVSKDFAASTTPTESQSMYRKSTTRACLHLAGLVPFVVLVDLSSAWAFDQSGYRSRADATLAELNAKRVPDVIATLARLDEMIAIGSVGMKEFAARQPKYAKLIDAALADALAMKNMTDAQLEEKWGEKGYGGDAVGIPLKSLDEASVARTYLELIIAPAEQYIYINRWQSVKKPRLLEQARDEAVELNKRLELFPED